MSYPTIPNVNPEININIDDIVNLLLASIAFEELGLAHIINAEAEKIQSVLGTLKGQSPASPSINDLIAIDNAVEGILRDVIIKEMLLGFKLEDVLGISTSTTTTTSTTTSTTTTTTTSTSSTTTSSTSSTTTTSTSSTTTSTSSTTTSSTSSTTTTSTTSTTTTTTSTTSTSTTTTCRPCLIGSGNGALSTSCDPRFNQFNIQDPSINASCCEPENNDPDNIAFRAQLVPSPGGTQRLDLVADTNTLTFQCMGNTLVVMGSGTATLILSNGTEKSGPVTFTYAFQDNGQQGNQDLIGIVITGVNDSDFNFTTCGLRNLTGNITVGSCT